MKKAYYLILFVVFSACNSENGNDCFQKTGTIIETAFETTEFSSIRIEGEVSLVIKQGDVQEIIIETGENLINDVFVGVTEGVLVIRDENTCNFVRDYGITKAYVTTPNITELRNSSSYDITSDGVLRFPDLLLTSDTSGGIEDVRKGGDFYLQIDCENFKVSANGQSVFYISGTADTARISFNDENPRFEGQDLQISELSVFQRSANKMIVHPIDKIIGDIRGTGDIIAVNRPPVVLVNEFFTGRLLFED